MPARRALSNNVGSGDVPAADLLGADGRADAHALSKTVIEAHAVPDARTDARTDDGDARAHTTTVRGTHTCSIAKTDDGGPFLKTDAVTLLV